MVEKQNINLNEPSVLELLSSQLTALACDFVFKANTNVYCIYPALRESRRLIEGIRHVVIMISVCYGTIFMSYFISEVIIGINSKSLPLLTKYQLLALIFFIVPLSCMMCFGRPWNNDMLMQRSVLN